MNDLTDGQMVGWTDIQANRQRETERHRLTDRKALGERDRQTGVKYYS